MTSESEQLQAITRRELFQNLGTGIGSVALASLIGKRVSRGFLDSLSGSEPAGTEDPSSRTAGEERDLLTHGRRAVALGLIRE